MNKIVEMNHVSFHYRQHQQKSLLAIADVSVSFNERGHTAILGKNGSGKSTLARLINALEIPDEGTVIVAGMDTAKEDYVWKIRSTCGMVFQNPDNQIVGTTVEEDVAFGPENLGFEPVEIRESVDEALARVELSDAALRPPHLLSGGQKQKLAIAGILAMRPRCLILDESTAMLDPVSRQEFMQLVQTLIAVEGITVINITHHMEEVLLADYVYVMDEGYIILQGTPAEIFDQPEKIKGLGLDVPVHTEIAHELALRTGARLSPLEISDWQGAANTVFRILSDRKQEQEIAADGILERSTGIDQNHNIDQDKLALATDDLLAAASSQETIGSEKELVISVKDLTYTYSPGTVLAADAIHDLTFQVYRGELFGVIGHSGSGKSTLIQHLNGLIKPQSGSVEVLGWSVASKANIKKIRQKAGLLFQYPEHQLFEETVYQDIAFGPKKMGLDANEVDRRVMAAAAITGLDQEIMERSPFELSGGQKRRVAIAGVLAMKPEILILDEPAAGLDPAGRDEILSYAAQLKEMGVTVILVSHSMEDIARLADRILVLKEGRIHACGSPQEIFVDEDYLRQAGLSLPKTKEFLQFLQEDIPGLKTDFYTPQTAVEELLKHGLKGGNL